MNRLPLAMLACLVFGAGGMWLASNFKLKVEQVGAPEQPVAAPVVSEKPSPAEPGLLPGHIVVRAPAPTGGVQQAGGMAEPVALSDDEKKLKAAKDAIAANPIEVVQLIEGNTETGDTPIWSGSDLASPILLRNSSIVLKFRYSDVSTALATTTSAAKLKLKILAYAEGSVKPGVSKESLTSASQTATIPLDSTEFKGKKSVTLKTQWFDEKDIAVPGTEQTIPLTLQLPTGPAPTIVKLFNSVFNGNSVNNTVTESTTLYPGFARVHVKSAQIGAKYDFFLYDTTKRTFVATPVVQSSKQLTGDASVTEFTLKWDAPCGSPTQLLIRETRAGTTEYTYVSTGIAFKPLPGFNAISWTGGFPKNSKDVALSPSTS